MKKILLLFTFISGFYLNAQTWTEQNTGYPVDGSYTGDISIVDANVVWTMVQRTSTTNHQTYGKSTNGGTTWTTGTINVGNTTGLGIGNITASDANTAWVSVFPTTTALGTQGVYKTTNGGATWTKQTTAAFTSASFVNFVHFWDANNGVCMGDKKNGYFEIYTTTNGGTTWTRTPTGNIAASTTDYGYTGKFYVKGNTVWFGTDGGQLMRSTNRGLNWTTINTPIADFGGGTVATSVGEFAFKDDNNGVIQQTVSNTFYVTTDGGANWTTVPTTGMFWGAIDYAGADMLVSAGSTTGNFGSSYSLDNGTTWTAIDALSHTTVEFLNATVGFGGGFTGTGTGVGGIFKFNNTLKNSQFISSKFSMYPNPTNSVINISNNDDIVMNAISISDINGRTVKQIKVENVNSTQINVSELSSGIYFMNISTDSGNAVKKFIKN